MKGADTNHWINLKREKTKKKKKLNLESWEKGISNTISLKKIIKRQMKEKMKKQTRNTEVQIN